MSLSGNTEKINELLSKINALPEAGSGGGTTLGTCTVTISMPIPAPDAGEGNVYFVKPDGNWSEISVDLMSSNTTIDVLQNSIMVTDITSDGDAKTTNCERIYGLYTLDVVYIGAVDSATVKIY